MKDKPTDPRRLDLPRLAAAGASLEGTLAAPALGRLSVDAPLVPATGAGWTVRGERRAGADGAAQTWLHLRASARVMLTCQRCLQPLEQPLEVDRDFRFVADEAEAERLDEDSEDDVLALPRGGRVDLPALVEDELILALPIVPRHADCKPPLKAAAETELPASRPFEALAALKRRPAADEPEH